MILVAFLVFLLQITIFKNLSLFWIGPDIALIFVIYFSFLLKEEVFVFSFVLGLLLDLFSPIFGIYTLFFLIIAGLLSFLKKSRLNPKNLILILIFVLLGKLFLSLIFAFLKLSWPISLLVYKITVLGIVQTLIITLLLYYPMVKYFEDYKKTQIS